MSERAGRGDAETRGHGDVPRVGPEQVDRLVERGKVSLPARGALVEPYGRWTEALAALRWCLASWRNPADDAARWEQ